MPDNFAHIALVLFTRTPTAEVRAKKLIPHGSPSQQLAVAEKLINSSTQLLAATGLPYFVFAAAAPTENSFGEALHQAFKRVFAQGYQQVIVIGNDCPQLNPRDILAAAGLLQHQPVVVGPDAGGGVYLLGLTRDAFESQNWYLQVRWQTRWVLHDLAAAFNLAPAQLQQLPVYFDVNHYRALRQVLQQPFYLPALKRFIRQILGWYNRHALLNRSGKIIPTVITGLYFRGPPVLI